MLRFWPRLPPSAVIALQFQPAPVFFCPIRSGKTSRPLPAPSQRYNTLDFASKVVCQGDAVPVGFPATKPPVSLDSSGQEGLSPSFGIHLKSKNGMCQNASTFHFAFQKCDRKLPDFSATFLKVARFPAMITEKNTGNAVSRDVRIVTMVSILSGYLIQCNDETGNPFNDCESGSKWPQGVHR